MTYEDKGVLLRQKNITFFAHLKFSETEINHFRTMIATQSLIDLYTKNQYLEYSIFNNNTVDHLSMLSNFALQYIQQYNIDTNRYKI